MAFGADIALARDNGAEGIGLYRTEFPFIVRDGFPTRDEQVRICRKAYDAFPGAAITFRLLDLAGDKFVSSRGPAASHDAFHGYRSIRVLFDHPYVLRDQVQALALAARARPLRILVPMVTSLQELLRVQAMTARAIESIGEGEYQRRPSFGAMIEVPGAIEIMNLAADGWAHRGDALGEFHLGLHRHRDAGRRDTEEDGQEAERGRRRPCGARGSSPGPVSR